MRDEHRQLVDELLLRLLVEEAAARDCAIRAETMAQEGLENAADVMLRLSHRHEAEVTNLRAKLAMLYFQDGTPATLRTDANVPPLRLEEQAAMTVQQLRERLAGLSFGAVVLMTKAQFEQVFAQGANQEAGRWAAVELAEGNGCHLMFRGGRDPYAVFMRRQRLSEVVLSDRAHIAA